jgi:starch phosphorylase
VTIGTLDGANIEIREEVGDENFFLFGLTADEVVFDPIINAIRSPHDPWLVAADFRAFIDAQERAAAAYRDRPRWARMSLLNTACSGKFSTDRTMLEYNKEIWKLTPVAPKKV